MSTIKLTGRRLAATRIFAPQASVSRSFTGSTHYHNGDKADQPSQDEERLAAKARESAEKGHKTVAEADAELMEKLAGHADEGGAAGVEYENGKPVAQKRSVRNNMFRLI